MKTSLMRMSATLAAMLVCGTAFAAGGERQGGGDDERGRGADGERAAGERGRECRVHLSASCLIFSESASNSPLARRT